MPIRRKATVKLASGQTVEGEVLSEVDVAEPDAPPPAVAEPEPATPVAPVAEPHDTLGSLADLETAARTKWQLATAVGILCVVSLAPSVSRPIPRPLLLDFALVIVRIV
jgi:hypothetical protein